VCEHPIDAECGVRRLLQLACKEPVTRNRRRRPFPLESAVPGFAEYLHGERGFAQSTIRNYRRHLDEFAEYLSRTGTFSQLSPTVLAAFILQYRPRVAPRTRLGFSCHLRVLVRFCIARVSPLGISVEPWGHHRYIDSVIYLVHCMRCSPPHAGSPGATYDPGTAGLRHFCFFW